MVKIGRAGDAKQRGRAHAKHDRRTGVGKTLKCGCASSTPKRLGADTRLAHRGRAMALRARFQPPRLPRRGGN